MTARDRILVVEDEGIVAMELEYRLRSMDFDVVGPAMSGEAAVAIAIAERPDLILMDVRLKGSMDGPEAALKIREHVDVPFVFLTAYADEATLARVRPIEPHAYLIKPLEERSLSIAIHMALYRHRAAQARAAAERARHEADARYAAVLDNTHDAIVSVDADCRITLFNKGAERIFGYASSEILGQPLDAILPEGVARAHRGHFDAFRTSGTTSRTMGTSREVVGRRHSGVEFPAEVTISRLELEGREIFTACIRDVSERRTLEEQFIRAQKMEAVGRLAASVAHDFNNLLTALQSNVYLLMKGAPEARELLQDMGAAINRGGALTRQLLGFSRQGTPHRECVAVNDLVHGAMALLRQLAREDVHVRTELHPDAGHAVVDGNLIEQVLMNLVANARDAVAEGGEIVIRTGRERVDAPDPGQDSLLPPGEYVRLDVSDSGGGIPPQLTQQVFDPFFTTKPHGIGTGLGLATVRTIARRSGGDVRLINSPGRGCTFRVLLPWVGAVPESARVVLESEPAPRGSEAILLVDDDPSVLRGLSQILSRSGYRVLEARSCDFALTVATSRDVEIDLLLTDLVMPGYSGRDLARRVTERRPGLPVVFMTGYWESVDGAGDGRVDGHVVLLKPVPPGSLLGTLRRELDTRARASESAACHQGAV